MKLACCHGESLPDVWVTGAGVVSPIAVGQGETAAALRAGKLGFRPVTLFDVSAQRARTAGEVDVPGGRMFHRLTGREESRVARGTKMMWMALEEARVEAGLPDWGGVDAFVVGTSAGAMPVGEEYFRAAVTAPGRKVRGQFAKVEGYQVQRQMNAICQEAGWRGPVPIISNACASGANAIGHAFQMVRAGMARRVMAGGYDALAQLVYAGFDSLQALAPSGVPRPFDAARDGLALGEGAGAVIVESAEAARERGATPIARIGGYGSATDLHHLTQPDPGGSAAARTMRRACEMAGREPGEVVYLNSHGTGTPLNDVAEAAAVKVWAGGDRAAETGLCVSSTKSVMGHLLGGAGAVESVIALLALRGEGIPASRNVREIDPLVTFDLVREHREASANVVMTNSFGFGGSNATLLFDTV